MTPSARLQTTLDLLTEVEATTRPVDAVTSGFFRTARHATEADRGAVLALLYALLRHRARLGWWLERSGEADTPRARLLVWLCLGERRTLGAIQRQFDGAPSAPSALSDAEEALLAGLEGQEIGHPDMPDEVRLECPPWALGPLRARFGAALDRELGATLTPPPLDLRINPLRTTREAALAELAAHDLAATPTPLASLGIRLQDRISLTRIPGLMAGEIEIQDEGSQLVAELLGAKPGDRVVDFCAGAGGKTLAIAAQMRNKGYVAACDINEARLKRCAERLRKAGLHNVETRLMTSESDRWVKRHKGGFDRVLIDAPCSGTGTWRRNPDARWRAPELGLANLVALQSRILTSAARLVRAGGRLVYATCSLLPEENEEQVARFLAANPAFRLLPLAEVAPHLPPMDPTGFLSLTPARHGTDGFFAAVLQREAAAPTG